MAEVGGGEEAEGPIELEYTPTWIVAAVCSVIVFISLIAERHLHFLGKYLKKKNQKPLFEAVLKVKEELMLLGFISLLLTVCQGLIQRICLPESWTHHMLPCEKGHRGVEDETEILADGETKFVVSRGVRLLLAEAESATGQCSPGKVPLLSLEAIDQLHIFIFVLAITHVVFTVLTMLLGGAKIRQWKHWEDTIQKEVAGEAPTKITHMHETEFVKRRLKGIGTEPSILSWLHSFMKQFYGSVNKSDYTTMRLGFIMTHCKANPKFDFYKYMVRALESDFKKVIGIRWYLWIFVIFFLILNVHGWHAYFWIAFIPLILLVAVGAKLEHVISQLAHEVAEKHSAIEGDLIVKPSDEHFWFHRPRLVLYLIHFILFQNAFEVAFFFWILTTYGFSSCIMGRVFFIVPRLVIGVIVQLLCSYSTLPLYAIVTQMGSTFKKAIFDEHVREGLLGWAQKVKRRNSLAASNRQPSIVNRVISSGRYSLSSARSSVEIKLQKLIKDSQIENGKDAHVGMQHKTGDIEYNMGDKEHKTGDSDSG